MSTPNDNESEQTLASFLNDLGSIVDTPTVTTFIAHPDLVPDMMARLRSGHQPIKYMNIEMVNMEEIPDASTINFSFYGSGFEANQLADPTTIPDKIDQKLMDILVRMIWLPVYNSYKDYQHPIKIERTLLNFLNVVKLSANVNGYIGNNSDLNVILASEALYKGLEQILERNPKFCWYMTSSAALMVSVVKNYRQRYFVDQRNRGLSALGVPDELMERPVVYDEFIDSINFDKDGQPLEYNFDNPQKIFIGDLYNTIAFKISDSMLIERIPVMVAKDGRVRVRDITEVEPDGDFIPGIQYNVTMKIQMFQDPERQPWLILNLTDPFAK